MLRQIVISWLISVYNNVLVEDTDDISKHLATRRAKFWSFPELNYEETRRIGVIFEGIEIVLMVPCLSIHSFVAPIFLYRIDVFFSFSKPVDLEFSSPIGCCTIYNIYRENNSRLHWAKILHNDIGDRGSYYMVWCVWPIIYILFVQRIELLIDAKQEASPSQWNQWVLSCSGTLHIEADSQMTYLPV